MDIITWLFSTAKTARCLFFLTKLKKVFATQQKLVEKMFNMLSKYNAGIWVKKNIKCEMLLFQVSENMSGKRFLFMSDTSDSKPEGFFLFVFFVFAVTFITYYCTNKL